MTTLGERLVEHVERLRLFEDPGLALLAVSGGPDSIALLDLMASAQPMLGLDLAVAHVDHGISPNSRDLAHNVGLVADHYGLRCYTETLALGSGATETTARTARYRVLGALQRRLGAKYLVTAHHADDQVETVVYRLLRGTGVAGLAGIPTRGPRGLVRPLLPFTKIELGDWLADRVADGALPFPIHRDPSNADARHDRSWLRACILPRVRERFGLDADLRVLQTAEAARHDRTAWSQVLRMLPALEFSASEHHVEVARAPFGRYDKVLSGVLLRAFAREADCHIGLKRTDRLLRFVHSGSSGRVFELGAGCEAELVFDRVRILRMEFVRSAAPVEQVVIDVQQAGRITWGDWEFAWRPEVAGVLARDSTTTWLTQGIGVLRGSQQGDRIFPLGGVGRRKVRRVLMEARVASRDRAAYPVLVRDDQVLWIPGVCRSGEDVPRIGDPAVRLDARTAGRSQGEPS